MRKQSGTAKRQRTVIALPADEHSGSTSGLMVGEQWQLSEGGYYNPSRTQMQIFEQFNLAADLVLKLRRRARLIVANVGDAVDNNHHETTQLVTPRIDEQERMHTDVMDHFLKRVKFSKRRGDLLYYVEGTPAHVQKGAQSEERIARDLGAVPKRKGTAEHEFKDGRYTWDHLKLNINGVLLDISHHPGVTPGTRAWTRGNALRSLLKSMYIESIDYKHPIPRYWIRAHRHKYTAEIHRGVQGTIEGFILPAFQSRTEYVNKIASHELATIGMLIIVIEPDGQTTWHCPHIVFEEDEYERI